MTGKPTKNCNTLYSVEYIPMVRKEGKKSFPDGHKAKIFTGIIAMSVDQYGSVYYELLQVGKTIDTELSSHYLNNTEFKKNSIDQQQLQFLHIFDNITEKAGLNILKSVICNLQIIYISKLEHF